MAPNLRKPAGGKTEKPVQSNGKAAGCVPKGPIAGQAATQVKKASQVEQAKDEEDETSVEIELEESESAAEHSEAAKSASEETSESEEPAQPARLSTRQPKQSGCDVQRGQARSGKSTGLARRSDGKSKSRSRSQRVLPRPPSRKPVAASAASAAASSRTRARAEAEAPRREGGTRPGTPKSTTMTRRTQTKTKTSGSKSKSKISRSRSKRSGSAREALKRRTRSRTRSRSRSLEARGRTTGRRKSPQRLWRIATNDGREWINNKNRPGALGDRDEKRAQEGRHRDRPREPLRLLPAQGAEFDGDAYGGRLPGPGYRDRDGPHFDGGMDSCIGRADVDDDARYGGQKGKGKGKGKDKRMGKGKEEGKGDGRRREDRRRRDRTKRRRESGSAHRSVDQGDAAPGISESRVFVTHLPHPTSEDSLTRLFTSFGEVLGVKVMALRRSGDLVGFVRFSDSLAAQAAITAMDKKELEGSPRPLEVKLAQRNKKWEAPHAAPTATA